MTYSGAERLHRMLHGMNDEYMRAQLPKHPVAHEIPVILESVDLEVQDHLRKMVPKLKSRFASGLSFPGRIFHYTGQIVTNERGQLGERVAILDSKGEMTMVRAFVENPYEEWDLALAYPDSMTGPDIRHQSVKLLEVMEEDRLEEVMLPEAIREGDIDRERKIRSDIRTIRKTKKAIRAALDRPVGDTNQDPQPAK